MAASFMRSEDGAKVTAALEAALRTGEAFEIEHRIRSSAGAFRWFLARAVPYRDARSGEIVRWFGASVDIDERKRLERGCRN